MRLIVATTAHPPGDVRVHGKVVASMLEAGGQVVWIGPHQTGGLYSETDLRITYRWLPTTVDRRDRLATVTRLARALRGVGGGADWVYCPDPDAVLAALAVRWGLGRGAFRLWFDIHEEYHLAHAASWLGRMDSATTRDVMRWGIAALAARTDLVTSPSPRILDVYASAHPSARLLLNAAPRTFLSAPAVSARVADDPLVLMHGKPGVDRGTVQIAQAMLLLDPKVHLRCVCFGTLDDLSAAIGGGLTEALTDPAAPARFAPHPWVPYAEMPALLSNCHAGIVNYTGDFAPASLPNRLFEFLAIGLPVLACRESPYVAAILEEGNCGLVFSNDDSATLASRIEQLFAYPGDSHEMGISGRSLFAQRYRWEAQFDRVVRTLEEW